MTLFDFLLIDFGIATALVTAWAIWTSRSRQRQLARQPVYARRAARPRRPNQA